MELTPLGVAYILSAYGQALDAAASPGTIKVMGGNALLAELTLSKPCASVNGNTIDFTPISDAVALADGKPDRFLFCDGDGAVVFSAGMGSGVTIDRDKLVAGGPVKITSVSIGF